MYMCSRSAVEANNKTEEERGRAAIMTRGWEFAERERKREGGSR